MKLQIKPFIYLFCEVCYDTWKGINEDVHISIHFVKSIAPPCCFEKPKNMDKEKLEGETNAIKSVT